MSQTDTHHGPKKGTISIFLAVLAAIAMISLSFLIGGIDVPHQAVVFVFDYLHQWFLNTLDHLHNITLADVFKCGVWVWGAYKKLRQKFFQSTSPTMNIAATPKPRSHPRLSPKHGPKW